MLCLHGTATGRGRGAVKRSLILWAGAVPPPHPPPPPTDNHDVALLLLRIVRVQDSEHDQTDVWSRGSGGENLKERNATIKLFGRVTTVGESSTSNQYSVDCD